MKWIRTQILGDELVVRLDWSQITGRVTITNSDVTTWDIEPCREMCRLPGTPEWFAQRARAGPITHAGRKLGSGSSSTPMPTAVAAASPEVQRQVVRAVCFLGNIKREVVDPENSDPTQAVRLTHTLVTSTSTPKVKSRYPDAIRGSGGGRINGATAQESVHPAKQSGLGPWCAGPGRQRLQPKRSRRRGRAGQRRNLLSLREKERLRPRPGARHPGLLRSSVPGHPSFSGVR